MCVNSENGKHSFVLFNLFWRLDIYQKTGLQNILYQLKITGTVHSCPCFASPLPTVARKCIFKDWG